MSLGLAIGNGRDAIGDALFGTNVVLTDLMFGVEALAFSSGRADAGSGLVAAGCSCGRVVGADGLGRAILGGGPAAGVSSALRFGGATKLGVPPRVLLGVLPAETFLPGSFSILRLEVGAAPVPPMEDSTELRNCDVED